VKWRGPHSTNRERDWHLDLRTSPSLVILLARAKRPKEKYANCYDRPSYKLVS